LEKNNTVKTSLLVLFEKFLNNPASFSYNDFPMSLRERIHSLNDETDINDLAIRLILEIKYDENDNLENLSEFILDLDPEIKTVKILFECKINKEALLKEVNESKSNEDENKEKLIIKLIDKHLFSRVYIFENAENSNLDDFLKQNQHMLVEKDIKHIRNLINLQIIHARREVSSSDASDQSKPLSKVTTDFFDSENKISNEEIGKVNDLIINMDKELGETYKGFFEDFLKNAKGFLKLGRLSVISNIQSKVLFRNASEVIYGDADNHLPEHLNGLGYMNILYLLLKVEIKKNKFKKEAKDINLLFIEEPEAHTHPQMQYVFANKIKCLLEDDSIKNLQALITSHSPHIVSQSDFEDIRYLKLVSDENVKIKNFHTELKKKYGDKKDHFKFLKQYLNIQSAELFFASKVIFIEGITERMLLPYFMKKFDDEHQTDDYIPLASQNISVLEVGANAKIFAPFLEFLDIKTLVITDIDTTKQTVNGKRTNYLAKKVAEATHVSNETLKYFYNAPEDLNSQEYRNWLEKIKNHDLESVIPKINVMYQKYEKGYHARSFEDAFLNVNKEIIKDNVDDLMGLQKTAELEGTKDPYDLIEEILVKKSHFASSVLYLALAKEELNWNTPSYIKDGLAWVQNDDGA
jgi:putative ATP-dependent endonuclease of OLD family